MEEVELVGAPVGRVGEGDGVGRAALELDHPLDHPAEQLAHQRLGAVGRPGQQDRRGVAHPALELAGEALGLGDAPAVGGVADQHLAVGLEEQHRRHRHLAVAEGHGLDPPAPLDRRGGAGRAESTPRW